MVRIIEQYTIIILEIILKDEKPDHAIVKCGNCKGNGCDYCKHTGRRKLKIEPESAVYKCGNCKGNGCTYCDYIGAYVGRKERIECGNCKGSGCTTCNYRGSIWEGEIG